MTFRRPDGNAGATMQNEDGYHSGVVVTGSFVNNGTVNGRAGGYSVEVDKNLTQNNVYTATETTFGGPGVDTISMGAGKKSWAPLWFLTRQLYQGGLGHVFRECDSCVVRCDQPG